MEAQRTKLQRFAPGEKLFGEGDRSREMYIIRSGRVRVTISKDGREIPITELGRGSFVGEMSLLAGMPRTASVTAIEQVYASVVSSDIFDHDHYGIPEWVTSIARTLVERIHRTTRILSDYIAVGKVPAITETEQPPPVESLKIQSVPQAQKIRFKGYFYAESVNEAKQQINKALAKSDASLILDFSGVIDIDKKALQFLGNLLNSKFAAEGKLKIRNIQLIRNKISTLQGVSSFIEAHPMPVRNVKNGEVLIRQGSLERKMYVVRTGRFAIIGESQEGEEIRLGQAEPGDVIGEMSLLHEGERSATVKALSSSSVYEVSTKEFYHGAYDVPDWFMALIRGLVERLRNTNEMLSSLTVLREPEAGQGEQHNPLVISIDSAQAAQIKLSGHLTFGNLEYLAPIIRRLMYKEEKRITLDLREVKKIDRASIRYLLNVHIALKADGGQLILVGQKSRIQWLYQHMGEDAVPG